MDKITCETQILEILLIPSKQIDRPQNGATGTSDIHGKAGWEPESELGYERMITQIFTDLFKQHESARELGFRKSAEEKKFVCPNLGNPVNPV